MPCRYHIGMSNPLYVFVLCTGNLAYTYLVFANLEYLCIPDKSTGPKLFISTFNLRQLSWTQYETPRICRTCVPVPSLPLITVVLFTSSISDKCILGSRSTRTHVRNTHRPFFHFFFALQD